MLTFGTQVSLDTNRLYKGVDKVSTLMKVLLTYMISE